MSHVSGQHGRLFIGTNATADDSLNPVAKVRDWSINLQHQPLDTTTLGDKDRVKTHGLRSYTGSGTLLYYTDDSSNLDAILDQTFHKNDKTDSSATDFGQGADPPNAPVKLELAIAEGSTSRKLVLFAYITSVNITCSTGEVVQAAFSFEGHGAPTTIYF